MNENQIKHLISAMTDAIESLNEDINHLRMWCTFLTASLFFLILFMRFK